MSKTTTSVTLNITYDDAEWNSPDKWNWAEIVDGVWVSGDDLNGTAIPLTAMHLENGEQHD